MRTIDTLADLPDFGAFLAATPFSFPCPRCGYDFHQTLGWFERNNQVTCGNCKETVVFDAEKLRVSLGKLREALEHLWQSVGYIA